jgi:hypothetical protein
LVSIDNRMPLQSFYNKAAALQAALDQLTRKEQWTGMVIIARRGTALRRKAGDKGFRQIDLSGGIPWSNGSAGDIIWLDRPARAYRSRRVTLIPGKLRSQSSWSRALLDFDDVVFGIKAPFFPRNETGHMLQNTVVSDLHRSNQDANSERLSLLWRLAAHRPSLFVSKNHSH